MIDPETVDIRLAVGEPKGDTAIKIICPLHKERIGTEDDTGSLAVFRHNVHCFGCGLHITRRYASLAFLLGAWDARGSEDSEAVRDAIREHVKPRLHEFVHGADHDRGTVRQAPPVDPYAVRLFSRYLFRYAEDRLIDELMTVRGLSEETIRGFCIGYTGTHFTIPVYDLEGVIHSIRYRTDEKLLDRHGDDYRKYEGTHGRNQPYLYPLQVVGGLHEVEALWIVEGEFDALATIQHGLTAITVTNGAGAVAKVVEMVRETLPNLLVKRWIIATDQDPAGEEAASKILSVLSQSGQVGVRARWEFGKDLGEYFASGGSVRRIEYAV